MASIKVQTALSSKDYRSFKDKADQLHMTEYELAQEAILVYIHDFNNSKQKSALFRLDRLLQRLADWAWEDIKTTP